MTQTSPSPEELDLLEILLRFGAVTNLKMFKIKCKQKGVNFKNFLEGWNGVIITQTSRGDKMVRIQDLTLARQILKQYGRRLVSHHASPTERKWQK